MRTGAYSGTRLLLLANRKRRGEASVSAFRLWQLADASSDSTGERRASYRHALYHSGDLIDRETGVPYAVCPRCLEPLGR